MDYLLGNQDFYLAAIPILPLLILGLGLALQILFPRKTEVVGPRQDDLKISTSTYGDHLARAYGRAKVAGAIIWVEDNKVKEVATTTTQKQKLFGLFTIAETRTTTFAYYATFAAAFTYHEITSFGKIFIDDEIWGDFTSDNGLDIDVKDFLGTATQLPPSEMIDDNGESDSPGYRGISYLLFRELPLEEIGIRIPNVEAEVIVDATLTAQLNSYTSVVSNISNRALDVEFGSGLMGNAWSGGLATVWRFGSREVMWTEDLEARDGIDIGGSGCVIDGKGNFFIPAASSSTNMHIYNVFTSQLKQTIAGFFQNLGSALAAVGDDPVTAQTLCWFYRGTHSTLARIDADGSVTSSQYPAAATLSSTTEARVACMRSPDSFNGRTGKLFIGGAESNTPYIEAQDMDTGAWVKTDMSSVLGNDFVDTLCYVAADDTLILQDDGNDRLVKVDAETPTTVVNDFDLGSGFTNPGGGQFLWSRRSPSNNNEVMVLDTSAGVNDNYIYIIDAVKMEVDKTYTKTDLGLTTDEFEGQDWLFDWRYNALIGHGSAAFGIKQLLLPRAGMEKILIADIIEAECRLAGLLVPDHIDVTGVTGDTWGYAIKDGTTPRAVIEDINRVKSKEFAQVDGIITFFDKGVTPVKTVTTDDMGASLSGSPTPSHIEEKIADPTEIPKAVTLEYPAFDANYRTGAQKITVPDGLDSAKEQLKFNTNMTMTDDEAAQSSDIILLESRDVALTYETSIMPKHSDLHPGDVITMQLDSVRQENLVVRELTQDVILEMELYRRQFDFASNAVGEGTNDGTVIRPSLAQVVFLPMDMPIVRDDPTTIHDDSGFYWCLYTGIEGSFVSATVYRSADLGATWTVFGSANEEAFVAAAVEPLAGGIEKAWVIDEVTTLDVTTLTGSLSSVTLTQGLNGSNLFAIQNGANWELANALTATQVSTNRYTLSDWIRGRNGTENYIDGHSTGDLVVRVNNVDIGELAGGNNVFRDTTDSINTLYSYQPQTTGLPANPGFQVDFTNTGVGKRPYAPWPVEGTRDVSENLDLTWSRRDRLFNHWLGGTATLSEDSEEYEIDLFEGVTFLRTVTGLTGTTHEYTLAQYQTDSGNGSATEIPTVTVFVYQISTIFGRGEAIEVDI